MNFFRIFSEKQLKKVVTIKRILVSSKLICQVTFILIIHNLLQIFDWNFLNLYYLIEEEPEQFETYSIIFLSFHHQISSLNKSFGLWSITNQLSLFTNSTFAVGVASFEIASIVSNVCQFVPKPQQRILQFDTHLPRNGISGQFLNPDTWISGCLDIQTFAASQVSGY